MSGPGLPPATSANLSLFFLIGYNGNITNIQMQRQEVTTESAEETQRLAGELVVRMLPPGTSRPAPSGATVLCLWGDLGAGKTTFAQGIGRELGVREVLNSPTFLIMKKYNLAGRYQGFHLYHLDTYRIRSEEDLLDLGWREILEDGTNIVVVEWPEKITGILPANRLDIRFVALSENSRQITFGIGA